MKPLPSKRMGNRWQRPGTDSRTLGRSFVRIWHCGNSRFAAKSCNGKFRQSCSWPRQRFIWQWTDRVSGSEWHVTFQEDLHRCEPFKMTAV